MTMLLNLGSIYPKKRLQYILYLPSMPEVAKKYDIYLDSVHREKTGRSPYVCVNNLAKEMRKVYWNQKNGPGYSVTDEVFELWLDLGYSIYNTAFKDKLIL